jgi:cytidine deaminase
MRGTKALFEAAIEAASRSYSPYSKFRVGAALLCGDGSIVTGANVENRSYGLTICAERSAVVSAVSAAKTEFKAIAIFCPDADYPVGPCGACRQVISEFVKPDFRVYYAGRDAAFTERAIGELLPDDSLHELALPPRKGAKRQ